MKTRIQIGLSISLLFLTAGFRTLPGPPRLDQPEYKITDLGLLCGANSEATGINSEGDIIGKADGGWFLYRAGTMTVFKDRPDGMWCANAINDVGLILGSCKGKDGELRPCLLQDNQVTVLQAPKDAFSSGMGLNNRGQVVGSMGTEGFLYQFGDMLPLFKLPGGYCTSAFAINNNDQIVGEGGVKPFDHHAFLYDMQQGMLTDLGTLTNAGGSCSCALAINDNSQVVGWSWSSGGGDSKQHAFLYSAGKMIDLGTLSTTGKVVMSDIGALETSAALAINNKGQVVGESMTHAFLYEHNTLRDLNSLLPSKSGWILNAANAINDKGQIVGYGKHNGMKHAFLLSPTNLTN